jgi:hypothetical protein
MLHFHSTTTARDVQPASWRMTLRRPAVTRVFFTEWHVEGGTATAPVPPPTAAHRHWQATSVIAAIGHIRIRLPEPRPIYPRRRASCFDDAQMSREMGHL